MLIIYEIFQIL